MKKNFRNFQKLQSEFHTQKKENLRKLGSYYWSNFEFTAEFRHSELPTKINGDAYAHTFIVCTFVCLDSEWVCIRTMALFKHLMEFAAIQTNCYFVEWEQDAPDRHIASERVRNWEMRLTLCAPRMKLKRTASKNYAGNWFCMLHLVNTFDSMTRFWMGQSMCCVFSRIVCVSFPNG